MIRQSLVGLGVLVAVAGATALRPADVLGGGSAEILVGLGDVVRVEDGALGCRVARRAGFGDQQILDCRRAGRLSGTYGVLLGDRKLLVVRFEERGVANVVFTGTHGGSFRTCR